MWTKLLGGVIAALAAMTTLGIAPAARACSPAPSGLVLLSAQVPPDGVLTFALLCGDDGCPIDGFGLEVRGENDALLSGALVQIEGVEDPQYKFLRWSPDAPLATAAYDVTFLPFAGSPTATTRHLQTGMAPGEPPRPELRIAITTNMIWGGEAFGCGLPVEAPCGSLSGVPSPVYTQLVAAPEVTVELESTLPAEALGAFVYRASLLADALEITHTGLLPAPEAAGVWLGLHGGHTARAASELCVVVEAHSLADGARTEVARLCEPGLPFEPPLPAALVVECLAEAPEYVAAWCRDNRDACASSDTRPEACAAYESACAGGDAGVGMNAGDAGAADAAMPDAPTAVEPASNAGAGSPARTAAEPIAEEPGEAADAGAHGCSTVRGPHDAGFGPASLVLLAAAGAFARSRSRRRQGHWRR